MILLGHLPNKRATQALSDYLTVQNIRHQVYSAEQEPDLQTGFHIYVEPEQYTQSHAIYLDFIQDPNQDKYLQASWHTNKVVNSDQRGMGINELLESAGILTKGITLLCVVIYLLSLMGYFKFIFQHLGFSWSWSEPYRLITPAFMHLSALHLVFNLGWWWYLGSRVEQQLGKQTLLIILISSALISNVSQALLEGSNFAGLSGVNYALAGFVWFCGYHYRSSILFLPNNIFVFLLGWMALGFIDVLPISMANWAHLVGLLCGIGLATVLVKAKR